MIITIDGPVGTGKSTIAKMLAEKLGFIHFDTGAMYRCLTYGFIKHRIDINDSDQIARFLKNFTFDVKVENNHKHYFYENEEITTHIRQEAVTSYVSQVSSIKQVREKLVELQRQLGNKKDAIFEGRDLGTIVFPQAELKIFLTATPEVRAKRRYDELKEKFPKESQKLTFEEVLKKINERDTLDSTREISPLKQADDAHVIDSSDLSINQVVEKLISIKNSLTDTLNT